MRTPVYYVAIFIVFVFTVGPFFIHFVETQGWKAAFVHLTLVITITYLFIKLRNR